jgi:hypothetical protein
MSVIPKNDLYSWKQLVFKSNIFLSFSSFNPYKNLVLYNIYKINFSCMQSNDVGLIKWLLVIFDHFWSFLIILEHFDQNYTPLKKKSMATKKNKYGATRLPKQSHETTWTKKSLISYPPFWKLIWKEAELRSKWKKDGKLKTFMLLICWEDKNYTNAKIPRTVFCLTCRQDLYRDKILLMVKLYE